MATNIFHRNVGHAVMRISFINRNNVGVIQGRSRAGFPQKALARDIIQAAVRGEDFDGDVTIQASIMRQIHLSHAACAKGSGDDVVSKFCARRQQNGFPFCK